MIITIETNDKKVDTDKAYKVLEVEKHRLYYFKYKTEYDYILNENGILVAICYNESKTVQHNTGSSKKSPKCKNCGSWKNHWIKIAGKWPRYCSCETCTQENNEVNIFFEEIIKETNTSFKGIADRGAHVIHVLSKNDTRVFIVPVCESDNPSNDSKVTIAAGTWFVRADQSICR